MLSRTAENLFWMGRYMERADATARLIEMGYRMAMLPGSNEMEEWRSVAAASGSAPDIAGEARLTPSAVVQRLLLDPDNLSSIRSSLTAARANGRAVRTALTQDMWEALNDGWRQLGQMDAETALKNLPSLLEWTKNRTAAFRGATEGSLLRNDGYYFLRMGGLIERADMTLRLLDVKYYVLLPETDVVGGGRDYHQWTSVLRATSALRAYHHVYKGDYTPWGIADFLILNAIFPRSVAYCYRAIGRFLDDLGDLYGEKGAPQATARDMAERLDRMEINALFQSGLHTFIADAIGTTRQLSAEISKAYHFKEFMRLNVRHATTYSYDPPADRCALRLRLYPPSFDSQKVLSWKVSVNGQAVPSLMTTATGDRESVWTVAGATPEVAITAEGEVEVHDTAGVVRGLKDTVRPAVYLRTTPLTQPDKRIEALGESIARGKPLDRMHALFNAVANAVSYKPATTTSSTTAGQALKAGQGVCQDHAHVFISAARTMGVPARYVVGYLLAPDANHTETHAWAEAWVQDIGWVGFDAANRLCPTDRYVRLGCGLDAADAAPIRGNVSGMHQERLSASVDISPSQGQNQSQNQEGQTQQ